MLEAKGIKLVRDVETEGLLDLTGEDWSALRKELAITVIEQRSGWMHMVKNHAPNLKPAWEFMTVQHAGMYPQVAMLIAEHVGAVAADVYMPIQMCALHNAKLC